MVTIAVIGYGYWGPNLVRNFFNAPFCTIKRVVDLQSDRLKILTKQYPSIQVTVKISEVFEDHIIDAVVIATPVNTHYSLAKKALQSGKHVLVEKPLTSDYSEALELVLLAKRKKKTLMVDHTFLYTDAVQKIKKIIKEGEIGKITYFDSMRTNLGLFQQDVNVFLDLAAHDISILNYLITELPKTIQAVGVSHTKNNIENMGFVTIRYKSGIVAHLNCSWSSPVKIRRILIGGTKKMIVYDDVEPSEKIKIYDTGYSFRKNKDTAKFQVDYRAGDIHIPKIELKEGLSAMANDFISAIVDGKKPISNAEHGLEVVKILSFIDKSIKNASKQIYYK